MKFNTLPLDGEVLTRQRGRCRLLPSPQAADASTTLATSEHPARRVRAWLMTGSRFPGSRVIASDHLPRDFSVSSGIYGRWLSAYSCGGSRGFAHEHARTAFPWLALAGTTNHNRGIRSYW